MAHLIFHHSLPVCLRSLQQVPVKPGICRIAVVDVNHVILEPKAKLFDFWRFSSLICLFFTGRFTILKLYLGISWEYHSVSYLHMFFHCKKSLKKVTKKSDWKKRKAIKFQLHPKPLRVGVCIESTSVTSEKRKRTLEVSLAFRSTGRTDAIMAATRGIEG